MYINLRLAASIIIIKMKIVLRASSPRPAGGFFDIDMPSISVIRYASREGKSIRYLQWHSLLWESFFRLSWGDGLETMSTDFQEIHAVKFPSKYPESLRNY